MPLILANNVRSVSGNVPVMTSPASFSVDEGQPLNRFLSCDLPISGIIFNGGADDAFFQAPGAGQIEWAAGFLPDFAAPADSGANNTYVTSLIFVGQDSINSIPYTVTFTVLDVVTNSVGAATLPTPTPISDTELYLNPSATNAVTYEYEREGNGIWIELATDGVVSDLQPPATTHNFKARGRADIDIGAASATVQGTTSAVPAAYNPNAVTFDGVNDYLLLTGAFSGQADGKVGTLVLCIDTTAGDSTSRRLYTNTNNYFSCRFQADNKIQVIGRNSANSIVLNLVTVGAFLANSGFKQIVTSFDLAAGSAYLMVNGVIQNLETSVIVNDDIDFTRTFTSMGAGTDGTVKFDGRWSDSAFHPVFIDLSNIVNRRKFFTWNGRVKDPGATGSNWFGATALMLLRGATSDWHTNDGTGGGFTLNGTLAQATVGPNGTLTQTPTDSLIPRMSDLFIEAQSCQYNRNWNVPRWQDDDSEPLLGALFVRYVRGLFNNSSTRAVANRIYTAHGIRVSDTFNEIFQTESIPSTFGTFDLPGTNAILADLKATSGISNPLGLAKVIAIEGPNEYQLENLIERIVTVNTTTDTITCTNQGSMIRNQTSLTTYANANPEWGNGTVIQMRTGTINGRNSANTGTVPGGLTKDTPYFIRDWAVVSNVASFKLSATLGGAAINITSNGTVPGGAHHIVSPWAPRVRAYQQYLWNQVTGDATYAAWHTAGKWVRGPSVWGRVVIDYEAAAADGGMGSHMDTVNLHLYNAARKPSMYNGATGNDPIIEAVAEARLMGAKPVEITETGYDLADTFGVPGSATCTEQIGSKYILRQFCEWWLLYLQGLVARVNWFSLLDNLKGENQGVLSYNEGTGVFTERLNYWSWRNLNHYFKDATWNGTAWAYPSFAPNMLTYTFPVTPANPDVKFFVLQKTSANGRMYFVVWHDWLSWRRGNPGGENTLFTVTAATDVVNVTAQMYADFATASPCTVTSSGTLPAPLVAGTVYYIIKLGGANQFKLATSAANASAGTAIDLTSAGTGTQTMTPRVAVTLTVFTPTFTTLNVYEPTVLNGESPNGKRDTPTVTSGSPHNPIILNVPDAVMVVELVP